MAAALSMIQPNYQKQNQYNYEDTYGFGLSLNNGYGNNYTQASPAAPYERTDIFPSLDNNTNECSPSMPMQHSQYPSSMVYGTTTTSGSTTGTTSTMGTSTDMNMITTGDDIDFSLADNVPVLEAPFWSTSDAPLSPSTTSTKSGLWSTTMTPSESSKPSLPMAVPSFRRVESFVGKTEGFEIFSGDLMDGMPTVAPAMVSPPSLPDAAVEQPVQYDFRFGAMPSPANNVHVSAFDLPQLPAIPMPKAVPAAYMYGNGYVDAAAEPDVAPWTPESPLPLSPMSTSSVSSYSGSPLRGPSVAPTSLARRITKSNSPPSAAAHAAAQAAALRPGPYTRGRAALVAAPASAVTNGPRELKPVPVARGQHAGLLGGGEMASVGIYTKDDRWRKIERLKEKRKARVVIKSTANQYACRKSFAERRPRVGGRFVKMDEETKRYLAATKPGARAPEQAEPSAALKAYAAQITATGTASSYHQQLAVAAKAASSSNAHSPLFGSYPHPPSSASPLSLVPPAVNGTTEFAYNSVVTWPYANTVSVPSYHPSLASTSLPAVVSLSSYPSSNTIMG